MANSILKPLIFATNWTMHAYTHLNVIKHKNVKFVLVCRANCTGCPMKRGLPFFVLLILPEMKNLIF